MENAAFVEYNTELFRRLAPFYDIMVFPITRVRSAFARFVAAAEGSRILDVASGTGKQALAFAAKGFDTTGVDLSEAMLTIARRNNPHGHARFLRSNGADLPFEDGTFDVVVMSFALHCMPANIRLLTLSEMRRVAHGERGVIALVDYALPKRQPARSLAYGLVSAYETDLWRDYIRSDLDTTLARAGLRVVGSRDLWFGSIRMWKCVPTKSRARNHAGAHNRSDVVS